MVAISRRVSYIIPSPADPPPYLTLPTLDQARRGHVQPFLIPKSAAGGAGAGAGADGEALQSNNPFLSPDEAAAADNASPNGHGHGNGVEISNGHSGAGAQSDTRHPRHCLGVTSLALDTSTLLANAGAPGGIMYSGGRDGLVCSWELHVPHKRRRGARYEILPGRGTRTKWERVGDGAEFFDEDEDEEDEYEHDSSDEEDAPRGEVPYEDRWEVDRDQLKQGPPPTTYRQSAQTHTDWVNAMVLCNLNQTVITASSDRTIRAWNPHASSAEDLAPSLIGTHRDYVRALAWAKHPAILFSGSLDRRLNLWDVQGGTPDAPVLSINMDVVEDYGGVGMEGERGSVYALGVDHMGGLLAAGTPERVIRLWDPRTGEKSVGKLIGHSDCVRSIILSEDGRYMLTGSSDTTVKLWSLAAHRCVHTFNHHTSSVWSLFSNHPNLERFYSGSRDGHLCAVDVEQVTDMSDGECVVLSRDSASSAPIMGDSESKSGEEGIRAIVGMDDEYVWTANGSADIKRWRDVGRRVNRSANAYDGASYGLQDQVQAPPTSGAPIVAPEGIRNKRLSVDEPQALARVESRDRAVAFAEQAPVRTAAANGDSSRLGVPRTTASGANVAGSIALSVMSEASSLPDHPDGGATLNGVPYASLVSLGMSDSPYSFGFHEGARPSVGHGHSHSLSHGHGHGHTDGPVADPTELARASYEERDVASDATPLWRKPDGVIAGRPGLVRSLMLNDRQHVLTVDTEGEVAAWSILQGRCVGRFSAAEVAAALDLERGVEAGAAVRKHSSEVLELVKQRVEGETMVITWCQVDTKIGSLVVHLEEGRVFDAEVYADEVGVEGAGLDTRLNLGKWALANLFKGLVKAEERLLTSPAGGGAGSSPVTGTSALSRSAGTNSLHISIERPTSPPHRQRALSVISSAPSINIRGIASPAATPAVLPDVEAGGGLSRSLSATPGSWQNFSGMRGALNAIPQSPHGASAPGQGQPPTPGGGGGGGDARGDYFSARRRVESSPSRHEGLTPGLSEKGDRERDRGLSPGVNSAGGTSPSAQTTGMGTSPVPATPATPSGGAGLMGKLKGFGKKKEKEQVMSVVVEDEVVVEEDTKPKIPEREAEQLAILDTVRSHPFRPPPPWEAPPLALPTDTALLISEESKDAGAWVVTYRSHVRSTEDDLEAIEANSPLWLLDYLFTSRTKVKEPVKLTFILEPVPGCGLKEMPDGTARLSASRILRARKVMAFIYDKLELGSGRGRAGSIVSMHSRISAVMPRKASGSVAAGAPGAAVAMPIPGAQQQQQGQAQGHRGSVSSAGGAAGADDFHAEDAIELVCGDTVVDPLITLATLKQYYGSGGDMLLQYRPRKGVVVQR